MSEIRIRSKVNIKYYNVQWEIENYSHLIMAKDDRLTSPNFQTGKDMGVWYFILYPEGIKNASDGDISICLRNKSKCQLRAFCELSLLNKSNEKAFTRKVVIRDSAVIFIKDFAKKYILFEEQNELLHNDTLLINLQMEVVEGVSYSTSVKSEIESDLNYLSVDYLNILNSSNMSDFVIRTKERTFNVHKVILAARSKVLAAMLSHNLIENRTNILVIEDVDPDVMDVVIQYIYSGKCQQLKEMAQALLPVSEKYCLEHLKTLCERTLISQLNSENVILSLSLADMYNLKVLKKDCINLICEGCDKILKSSEWKKLATDNKTLAVEVLTVSCLRINQRVKKANGSGSCRASNTTFDSSQSGSDDEDE